MGINLSDVAADVATCPITYRGQSADVTYKPSRLTATDIQKVMATDDIEPLTDYMVELLVDWDVRMGTGKGVKVPIKSDKLAALPIPFLRAVMTGIMTDGQDLGEVGRRSAGG